MQIYLFDAESKIMKSFVWMTYVGRQVCYSFAGIPQIKQEFDRFACWYFESKKANFSGLNINRSLGSVLAKKLKFWSPMINTEDIVFIFFLWDVFRKSFPSLIVCCIHKWDSPLKITYDYVFDNIITLLNFGLFFEMEGNFTSSK